MMMGRTLLAALTAALLAAGATAAPASAGCSCTNWYYSRYVVADGAVKLLATNYDYGTGQQYHVAQQSGWVGSTYYQANGYFMDGGGTRYYGEGFITLAGRVGDHSFTGTWVAKTGPSGRTLFSTTRTIPAF